MEPPRKRQRQESLEVSGQGFSEHSSGQTPQTQTSPSPNTIVCFGMVAGFTGTFTRLQSSDIEKNWPTCFPVTITSSHEFSPQDHANIPGRGKFSPDYIDIVHALLDESKVTLHASCSIASSQQPKGRKLGSLVLQSEVSIILYGPLGLVENVGQFFQDLDIYLQDPNNAAWDVKYCNPHRLSPIYLHDCPMTSELDKTRQDIDLTLFQNVASESDVFDILNAHQHLPEAAQPELILSTLERHQKQALTFLQQREGGWDFDPRSADFWDFRQTTQATFFVNNISQTCQVDEPDQFRGGIVADPMGLGKTLTMIALIAAEKNTSSLVKSPSIIIVPPPLLGTWEEQLGQHVRKGGLSWRRHYGKDRINKLDDIEGCDIVISTYNTVSADWGGGGKADTSLLFSITWSRIVLDEAHMIRNLQSQMSRAVCALNSTARWAVTGTPIQNKIGDLAALLKFIRAHPYDSTRQFELDIGQLWKLGNIEEAIGKLRKLASGLVLRRPKTVIQLPKRTDLKFPIEFSPSERDLYKRLKHQTITRIEEAFRDGDSGSIASNSYITVMQRINALRMVCDLGLNYDARHELGDADEPTSYDRRDWSEVAQQTFNLRREVSSSVVCASCDYLCDTITTPLIYDSPEFIEPPRSYFAKCQSYVCIDCTQRCLRQRQDIACGHTPSHPIAPVSTSAAALEETAISPCIRGRPSRSDQFSSKVQALVSHLRCLPPNTKSVVFSSWRMTLNLVETGLNKAQISFVRFDGKVRQQDRQAVIDKFRKDPKINVFLLTLSCGAVGLTLTEASRAYLIEPHWNPTIEEQALARVYRLGQKQEVTTVRFFIKDTFEERVLELQRSKQKLEEVLLAPRKRSENQEESLNSLEDLRRLI